MQHFVIMGVSGCGKTTVGQALANRIGLTFIDGDTLHPKTNIAKMASGVPLDDQDREPWLHAIGERLAETQPLAAIGCSALKRKYRDLIRSRIAGPVGFLHLHGSKPVLASRVANRPGHFMPESLLDSQFATLEVLQADEDGLVINIDQSVERVVSKCERYIKENQDG